VASLACESTLVGTADGQATDAGTLDRSSQTDADNGDHASVKPDTDAKLDQGGSGVDQGKSPDAAGPCASKTCGTNETCIVANGQATCVCTPGYIKSGQGCVLPAPGSPCDGQTCGGHGNCTVMAFVGAKCECFPGYISWGMTCIDLRKTGCLDAAGKYVQRGTSRCDPTDTFLEVCHDADGDGLNEWTFGANCNKTPCSTGCLGVGCANGQACPTGTVCVPEAHEQPLYVCVPTCDCSNCGNCSMADFAASGAMQANCGSQTGTPTVACKLPCPLPGDGCIPYQPAICWPMEGCLSGAP
jgi:hypothetical protein